MDDIVIHTQVDGSIIASYCYNNGRVIRVCGQSGDGPYCWNVEREMMKWICWNERKNQENNRH